MNRTTARKKPASSKKVFLAKAVISLGVAYIFASLAIDTGSLWFYLFAIILIVFGINQSIRTFTK